MASPMKTAPNSPPLQVHYGMRPAMLAAGTGSRRAMARTVMQTGLPIALRPFRPEAPIETVLLRPAGRPTSRLAERLIVHLKAERDALVRA